MGEERGRDKPEICISIDVERDYRLDRRLTVRGIVEGLPVYLDLLRTLEVPYDLFVSGEVVDELPTGMLGVDNGLAALGCHGLTHEPGVRSYLNRKPRPVLERELRRATEHIRSRFGRHPAHFRAPNFSTSLDVLRAAESLGYDVDSSVLPGRYVRRWRLFPILDHRGAPVDPYHPDPSCLLGPGLSRILEVPITANPDSPGAPIGLGFLHSHGHQRTADLLRRGRSRYVIFLAHSWEMVDWSRSDSVAEWVRSAGKGSVEELRGLVDTLQGDSFVNMDSIYALEGRHATSQSLP